jgi:hypothetical protein
MERGLLVELSSNDQVILRRVAHGIAESSLPAASVNWLNALSLVERKDQKIVLTEVGKARLAALSSHQPYIDPNSAEFTAVLAKALGVRNIE